MSLLHLQVHGEDHAGWRLAMQVPTRSSVLQRCILAAWFEKSAVDLHDSRFQVPPLSGLGGQWYCDAPWLVVRCGASVSKAVPTSKGGTVVETWKNKATSKGLVWEELVPFELSWRRLD